MKQLLQLFLLFILSFPKQSLTQQSYKELILDNSVNFYEVCAVADAYFETIDKDAKGSGYKGYQRWKYHNESKYYPSGNRSLEDPYFLQKSYQKFIENSSSSEHLSLLFEDGWEEVGPITVDSITGHYAPGLGRVECFYVHPDDEDLIYMGSRSGGFWKSTNGGDSWEGGSTDFLFASGVNTMTVSPTNSDSILINLRNAGNGYTHGLYRSTDGGNSWFESNFNPITLDKGGLGSNFRINQIAYHPRVSDLIFIAASDGLYRSEDNLVTWSKVTSGSISEIEFHPVDNSIIYIYDYYYWGPNKNKVLRSTDQGITFSGSAEIIGNDNNTNVHLDVSPICEDCLYFGSGNGLWISYDKGLNFEFRSNPDMSSEGFAISDVDTMFMTYGGIDAFASNNGGISFDQVTWWGLWAAPFDGDQYVHADMRSAECIDGNFYLATDGYLAKSSDNGISWQRLCDDVGIRENYTLGVSQSNQYITMVGSQDNGTSIKLESGWIEFAGADGMEAIIHPLNEDWMISSYQYGGRRRTLDRGQTQTNVSPPDHSSAWVAPMAFDPNDHMTVYHFGVDVHKSTDYGNSWEVKGSPSFGGEIQEAAIAENNSQLIIVSRGQDIELSDDGGVTFTDIQGELPPYSITDIAFDPRFDSTVVVTYNRYQIDGQKVFITHDLGETWENITANLEDMPIRGAVIDHDNNRNIYLAGEIGVYVKEMEEEEWELYNENLPNCMNYELDIVYGSNTLRTATWGRGVWEYTLNGRTAYPTILKTDITNPPTFTTPAEGSEQYVSSIITYDYELDHAEVLWSIDEPTFENTIPMINTEDTTWVAEDPIPSFPVGTKVYFKVRAVGEFTEYSETYKFMYTVQPFEYCTSYGNMSWETAVTRVTLNDLDNSSGKLTPYTSYVDLDTANLYQTMTYDLSVNLNTDGPYTIHSNAWIDWNRDGDFTDPGESYDLGTANDEVDGATSLSPLEITVPEDAHLGKTRMRVSAKYPSDADPCEEGFDGEVEDYTIFIKPLINLDYTISEHEICEGKMIYFEYTGSPIDAIDWDFMGDGVIFSSDKFIDSLLLPVGEYNLSIEAWEGEISAVDYLFEAVIVHPNIEAFETKVMCKGDELEFGTQTLTAEGVYTELFETIHGCDSIVTLTLSYYDLPTTVVQEGFSLEATLPDVSYQWVDCDEDYAFVVGATEQIFSPVENGSYAVIIDDGVCSDTSDCFNIAGLRTGEEVERFITIYPNPSTGEFSIELNRNYKNIDLKIYSADGKVVYEKSETNSATVNVTTDLATGTYFLAVQIAENEKSVIKIIIE